MLYIGAGGWAYFNAGYDPLTAYAKAFNFVEVNSTFYTDPSPETVGSWRRRVPRDFVFSVRCHRDLTHTYRLAPCRESHDILGRSLGVCRSLKAEILHIQTPPSFNPDEKLKDIKDLVSSFDPGNTRLAWEIRGRVSPETAKLMDDLGIIHCTDISREMPAVDTGILYTRLFGHGKHNLYQFDDTELLLIDTRIKEKNPKKAYVTFHGVKMYRDAARLKIYEKTGKFPGVTKKTGLESLKTVLEEDTVFPATRDELIENQGWKVFDLTENESVHAGMPLERLPDGRYASVEEVIGMLKRAESYP